MNNEIWLDHPAGYIVSDEGSVIGKMGKLVGYRRVDGYRSCNSDKEYLIHILVWETFIGKVPYGYEVNHIDLNRSNNRLSNLEILTHKDNIRHAYRVGLKDKNRGDKNPNAKLTKAQADQIKQILRTQKTTQRVVAKQFNISRQTISLIGKNGVWNY